MATEEQVRTHHNASPEYLPAWRLGEGTFPGQKHTVVPSSRHAAILRILQEAQNLTPEQSYQLMDRGVLEPGWVHRHTGDFVDRHGRALARPQWGQAAVRFRGKVHTGDFHAEALDALLAHYGHPRAADGGLDSAVQSMPDLDSLDEGDFGGIGKQGQFIGFGQGEWHNKGQVPLKNLGGRVK